MYICDKYFSKNVFKACPNLPRDIKVREGFTDMILELFLEGTRAYQGDILRKSISGQRHSKCKGTQT